MTSGDSWWSRWTTRNQYRPVDSAVDDGHDVSLPVTDSGATSNATRSRAVWGLKVLAVALTGAILIGFGLRNVDLPSSQTVSPRGGAKAQTSEYDVTLSMETHLQHYDKLKYAGKRLAGSGDKWKQIDEVGAYVLDGGAEYRALYSNKLEMMSLLHAHGQIPPAALDGVPYMSSNPVFPNRSQLFAYPLFQDRVGSFFIHGHMEFHHEEGVSAPFIYQGRAPAHYPLAAQLDDSGTEDSILYLRDVCPFSLHKFAGHYGANATAEVLLDKALPNDVIHCDHKAVLAETRDYVSSLPPSNKPPATTVDTCDKDNIARRQLVDYVHYIANGRTLTKPVFKRVKAGGYIRLHIINAAGTTNFRISFNGLTVSVVSVDGEWIHPVEVDNLWVGVAQRADVLLKIPNDTRYLPILATAESFDVVRRAGIVYYTAGNEPENYTVPPIFDHEAEPIGLMGAENEVLFRAWRPLEEKTPDLVLYVNMSMVNGTRQINNATYIVHGARGYNANPYCLMVKHGQRVHMKFFNFNPDNHAMHLHGHIFQVIEVNGKKFNGAKRDTVLVPAACGTATVAFDAINPGTWALHCHMSFHMAEGMFTTMEYTQA